jgi:hypothetical protein
MPYAVRKSGSGYKVFNKESGKSYSKKPLPKDRAQAQMRAIYANSSAEAHTESKFNYALDAVLAMLD